MGGRDETTPRDEPDETDPDRGDADPEGAISGDGDDTADGDGTADGVGTADGTNGGQAAARDAKPAAASDGGDGLHQPPGVWKRWIDGKDNLHLHRFSSVLPQVTRRQGAPYLEFLPESDDRPTFTDPDTGEVREFVFVGGWVRQILRHTPLVLFVVTLAVFVGAEFASPVQGLSELLPVLDGRVAIALVWGAFAPILVYLFAKADVLGGGDRSFVGMVSVYGLPVVLGSGVAISAVLVMTANDPTTLPPNIVFVSGYLLTMLVGGQIFYDTILRVENLIVDLPETQIVRDENAYYRLVSEMAESLSATVFGVPAAIVFGLVFAVQFGVLWTLSNGPQHLGYTLNILANTALNVVLVVATFQFIIVIRYLNELFSDEGRYSEVLGYEPFHVDGRGGYRDLGRFAIRFNVLIGLGAFYLVYRLYATGSRALPAGGIDNFTQSFDMMLWLINYAGPVLVFGLVLALWVYLGFWSMHMKMLRERDRIAWAFQGTAGTDGDVGAGVPVSELQHGPTYQYIANAPVWPVQPQRMTGIISGAFLPLVLPLPGLLL